MEIVKFHNERNKVTDENNIEITVNTLWQLKNNAEIIVIVEIFYRNMYHTTYLRETLIYEINTSVYV